MDDETYERIFEVGGTVAVWPEAPAPEIDLGQLPPRIWLSWADFSDLHRRLAADPRTQSLA